MIELTSSEKLITLGEAAKFLRIKIQRDRLSVTTVWRWCREGTQGTKLEFIRVGRTIFTSQEALQRFTDRCTEAGLEFKTRGTTPRHQTPAQIRRDDQRAAWRIKARGCKVPEHLLQNG